VLDCDALQRAARGQRRHQRAIRIHGAQVVEAARARSSPRQRSLCCGATCRSMRRVSTKHQPHALPAHRATHRGAHPGDAREAARRAGARIGAVLLQALYGARGKELCGVAPRLVADVRQRGIRQHLLMQQRRGRRLEHRGGARESLSGVEPRRVRARSHGLAARSAQLSAQRGAACS
jgi:hypothetical protein